MESGNVEKSDLNGAGTRKSPLSAGLDGDQNW